jgi:hypothetical protein
MEDDSFDIQRDFLYLVVSNRATRAKPLAILHRVIFLDFKYSGQHKHLIVKNTTCNHLTDHTTTKTIHFHASRFQIPPPGDTTHLSLYGTCPPLSLLMLPS